jgi:UDP-N-acetyl-D-glucosamine/UDP-N-acetyl-D-galactosamine dehydrogenase
VGYSPERINPGDKYHRLPTIVKITNGSTAEAADAIDALDGSIITAGTYNAASIEVAEAAKVIENTQRDLNIALINDLAEDDFNDLDHLYSARPTSRLTPKRTWKILRGFSE